MPIENKDAFVTGHYKNVEAKIMAKAAKIADLKEKEDFLNETIELSRKELIDFINRTDESNYLEVQKKINDFIN